MKYLLIFFLCGLLTPPRGGESLNKDCKTTIVITDCDDKAVSGANVSVILCSDNSKRSGQTNSNGEVSFNICKSNICYTKVIINTVEKTVPGIGSNCSGDENNTVCSLKICDQ